MVLEMAGKTDPGLFRAGVGRAVITPPVGFVIDGPEHGARESTGVLDDLLARVIVLESNGTRVILVSLDVWGLSTGISGSIKTAAGAASGGDANSVWLTTTGNASSPPLWRDDPQYARYAAYLPEQIAGAARMAVGSLEPASMGSKGTLLPDVSTFIEGPGRPGNAAPCRRIGHRSGVELRLPGNNSWRIDNVDSRLPRIRFLGDRAKRRRTHAVFSGAVS